MNIRFYNDCRYVAVISMDSGLPIEIQPYHSVSLECNHSAICITVKRNITSEVKQGKYMLAIDTQYRFADIQDQTVFRITREKIRVNLNVYFDRLFLVSDTATGVAQSYDVLGAEKIKKRFNWSQLFRFLIFGPLDETPGLLFVMLILGVFLSYHFGRKLALWYFPLAYLFVLAINWFVDKFCDWMFKKGFKAENERTEFHNCLTKEFLMKYYSDPNRTPFLDEIELN